MSAAQALSFRIAQMERKVYALPNLKMMMEKLAAEIQDAEQAAVMLADLEARFGGPVVPEVEDTPAVVEDQPAEVEEAPARQQPEPAVSEEPALPEPEPIAYYEATDQVLAALDGHWRTAVEVTEMTKLGRSTVQRICKRLHDEGQLRRRGEGRFDSAFEYTLSAKVEHAPVPPQLALPPKPPRTERILSHEANLPRDLPPVPVKSRPITPDDIDAVRKVLAERPSKSASLALLSGRVNRSPAHTEAVLEYMGDEVLHDGTQWRLT